MQNKIGISRIAVMMSQATGRPRKLCEDFIRELFALVSESLESGENVRVKGFGTFRLVPVEARKSVDVSTGNEITIPAYTKVSFVASRELASLVNSPFEMFQAVELADDADNSEEDIYEETESEAEVLPVEPSEPQPRPEPQPSVEPETLSEQKQSVEPEISACPEPDNEGKPKRKIHGGWIFAAGFFSALLLAVVIVFAIYGSRMLRDRVSEDMVKAAETESVATEIDMVRADSLAREAAAKAAASKTDTLKADTAVIAEAEAVATSPSDTPVYDTVSTTRYLTTIASEHYGNFNLWPYIYKENEAMLGHPDRIRPGTRVVVPPLSKYGVNPRSKADIEKAKRLGNEIYSRYRNK